MKNLKRLHPSGASMALSTVMGLALFGASLSSGIAQEDQRFIPPGQFEKLVATASSLELIEAQLTEEGVTSEPVELFRIPFELRPNNMTDLVIQLNGECAAWVGTAEEEIPPPPPEPEGDGDDPIEGPSAVTGASVTVWAEVNGEAVAGDDGAVVFCNSNGSGEVTINVDELIEEYEKARATNGFQWVTSDVGQGAHELVIMAGLELHTAVMEDDGDNGDDGNGDGDNGDDDPADRAAAIVGNRVLVLERTRALFDNGSTPEETEF